MFTEQEVKNLENTFILARGYAAQNHGEDFNLMKGLINLQEVVLGKMISTFPKEDAVKEPVVVNDEVSEEKEVTTLD